MQDALLYSTSNQMQRRDAAVALAAVLPQMKWEEDERILDVGSGSGDVTISLLSQNIPVRHQMVGLDCSEEMVEFANNNHATDDITFHHMNIEKATNPGFELSQRFNKIFSFYCLHWVKDLQRSVENMYDLMEEGGEGLILFIASNPIFRMYSILAKSTKWATYMKNYEDYLPVYQDTTNPKEDFRSIIVNTGFEVKMCEVNEHSYLFKNQNQLLQALTAVNPFLHRVPESSRKEFMRECLNTLTTIVKPQRNGQVDARYLLMVAHFKKPKAKSYFS